MSPREGQSRPKFGRIDPFCLMAVLPILLVAGIIGSLVNLMLGLGCAVFAGLIILFDSWANRPGAAPPPPPPERPVRAARPAPARAPARRPGPPQGRQQAPRQQGARQQAPRQQPPRARQAPGGAPYR